MSCDPFGSLHWALIDWGWLRCRAPPTTRVSWRAGRVVLIVVVVRAAGAGCGGV